MVGDKIAQKSKASREFETCTAEEKAEESSQAPKKVTVSFASEDTFVHIAKRTIHREKVHHASAFDKAKEREFDLENPSMAEATLNAKRAQRDLVSEAKLRVETLAVLLTRELQNEKAYKKRAKFLPRIERLRKRIDDVIDTASTGYYRGRVQPNLAELESLKATLSERNAAVVAQLAAFQREATSGSSLRRTSDNCSNARSVDNQTRG